jgi:spore germination cell wall hydrolase CwlJ-like protein
MKHSYVKTFMVILIALTMSACASMRGTATVYPVDSSTVVADTSQSSTLADQPNPLPVVVVQEELKTPEIQVPEVQVEVRPILYPKTLSDHARVVMSDAEIQCMAQVIYFEARGEGTLGMVGVGYTVLNRMGSPKFKPSSACGIVYERNRRGCQFSWVCDGKPDKIRNWATYERAREIAVSVMTREAKNPVGDSIFFRHKAVKSRYASSQRLVTTIGHHRFFVALN